MKKLGFKKLSFLALIFTLAVGLFACSSAKQGSSSNEATKLKVVATNSIIADITKNIAGDKIDFHTNTNRFLMMLRKHLRQTLSYTTVLT